ncbi:MAG TPA: putative lipid II flippase FtsW [Methylomirabilota bacterium]|nr:putative lipid II flippase FtsW [Methylomirabilota bacterium]
MKFATTVFVFCVAALLALGTVMLYSSPTGSKLLTQQLIWTSLGLIACAAATLFDYRKLKKNGIPWALLVFTLWLLIAVLIPYIGVRRGGAYRWINLHFMMFQPSELAKLVLIIVIACYAERFQRQMHTFKRGLVIPAAFILPVLGLIFLEPDYGTTLLLAGVSAVMLIIAGVRLTIIAPALLIGLLAVGYSVAHNENRLRRVMAFLHPEQHREGGGFQQYQAMLALGSGGTTGVGLGDGRQKYYYVPENHTDFIFSIIGEELGLVATLGVVLAFLGIALSGVYIAMRSCDRFGMMLGCGITFLISLQAFVNIGVVTTVLPNKGLPLPFVSYGGSSLLMMLTGVGLLLSVARHAHESVRSVRAFNPFNPQEIPSTQVS